MKEIKYFMDNTVNGKRISLTGQGSLSDVGEMRMKIKISAVPDGWNPIMVPCICSGPGPGPNKPFDKDSKAGGLIRYAPNGYRTSPGKLRRAMLFDHQDIPIAAITAIGVYSQNERGLDFDIKVETKIKLGTILPSLNKIDYYTFSIEPINSYQVKVYAHYSLSNENHQKVYGWTQIYYDLIDVHDSVPFDIIGTNQIDISFNENILTYNSLQKTRSGDILGDFNMIL